jgi:hypothetical protein
MQFAALSEVCEDPLQQQMMHMNKIKAMELKKAQLEDKVAKDQFYGFNTYGNNDMAEEDDDNNNGQIDQSTFQDPSYKPQYLSPPFMTAQGDFSKQGPYFGTHVEDLKRSATDYHQLDEESLSLLDTPISRNKKNKRRKKNHDYYITQFLQSIVDDISVASSQDDDIYDHIKNCKYCRSEIGKRMKDKYSPDLMFDAAKSETFLPDLSKTFPKKIVGYEITEIIIIIVVGIAIIFILDLLVRIGMRIKY